MRRVRWFLLSALFILVVAVAATFYFQRQFRKRQVVTPPPPLSERLASSAQNWTYTQMDGDTPIVTVSAEEFEQSKDQNVVDLKNVELKLYKSDATQFDLVRSAKVQFDRKNGSLFSEGEVLVTMGLAAEKDAPQGRLLNIKSSGVRFDARSGRAETDRPATFSLDLGEGEAVGAAYDPASRELHLKSAVKLKLNPKAKGRPPMLLECGDLLYKETEAVVHLTPWSKLKRGGMNLDAGIAVVHLDEGIIRSVEASNARGTDRTPKRQLDYSANDLSMLFNDEGIITKTRGTRNAHLVSTSPTARAEVNADLIEMTFDGASGESELKHVIAMGHSTAESKPIPRPNAALPETRILRSDTIELNMRDGGREIERMQTHAPGKLEFLPNRPGQPKRELTADRMTIEYAAENRIRTYSATKTVTRTWRTPKRKGDPDLTTTTGAELRADFDPKSGEMTRMEQWGSFRYEEGERRAVADRATLDNKAGKIHLNGHSRAWDPTGSTTADQIHLDQATNDFRAEGNVSSTRMPEKKKKAAGSGAMLSGDEPLQAKAPRMYSEKEQSIIHYEGGAVLWQGANRLHAETVVIDRENETLTAVGNVFNQLVDKGKDPKKAPIFTVVRSKELVYTGSDKLAWYKGGVDLRRPEMQIKAHEVKAWMMDKEGEGSSLDHAFASGDVDIFHRTADRTRHGVGQESEYYVNGGKVVLSGGNPQMEDSLRGSTKGRKLTWFAGDDRLLVDGVPTEPVRSVIRRKK